MEDHKKISRLVTYIFLIFLSYTLGYYTGISLKPPIKSRSDDSTVIQKATSNISRSDNLTDSSHLMPKETRKPNTTITDSDFFKYDGQCASPVPISRVRTTLVDGIFNGTDPYINFPPPYLLPFLNPDNLWGWGSQKPVFERLVRRVKPRTIIEIGSFLGASAIHMANISEGLGLRPQILCIDDYRGFPAMTNEHRLKYVNGDTTLLHQFMYNVNQMNFSDMILPLPFSTNAILWQFCHMGVTGDLIEVDAAHDFHSAWNDINLAYRLLRPGGVMFGHDYFNPFGNHGVRRAVNLFAKLKGLRVQPDGEHWVLEPK